MKGKHHIALGLITFLVYVFLIGPLLIIMAASFGEQNALVFPGQGFTLKWYAQVFRMSSFIRAAVLSLEIAFAATGIALLLGVPAAYAINRYRIPGKNAIKTLFLSPVLIPCIVLGFIMLRYIVNQWNLSVIPSLLIGHTLLSVPYVMRVVTSSLANFDFAIEEAAGSLGAPKGYSFFHIVLPNIRSGIASACVMAVINSFNNVSLSTFLTAPGVKMLPIEIMGYVEYHFDPTIAALATVNPKDIVDVVFAIDATGSMKDDIEMLREKLVPRLTQELAGFGDVRFGLLLYRDYGDNFWTRGLPVKFFDFTKSLDDFIKNLNGFKILGMEGGDIPEPVYEALFASMEFYKWRDDASKKIILIGDAEPHPTPRRSGKYSKDLVEKTAREKNVSITAIITPDDKGRRGR